MISVEIDRPPANAFDKDAVVALHCSLDEIETDQDVHAVLFWSRGRFFSAGADIYGMGKEIGAADGTERLASIAQAMQDVFGRVEALSIPSVCALAGIAIGGGLELALACDIRVAERSATLGLSEAKLGLVPGAGGTQRLTRIAGTSVARRLILTGELISGERAHALGIVHDLVEDGGTYDAALALCRGMADIPRGALAANKRCLRVAPSVEGLQAEIAETLALQKSPETRELILSFMARRAARPRT